MEFALGLIIGLAVGLALAWVVSLWHKRHARQQQEVAMGQMRETFFALAAQALDANSRQLTIQAESSLDGKKKLIDQSIKAINDRLAKMGEFVQRAESDRKAEYSKLSSSVGSLATTTGELHKMLASTQRRGAWGERMAEDILRLAGLVEGVNYRKQSAVDADSGRPDFTFLLPNDLTANMDVKFPLENYKAYLDAQEDQARTASASQLVRDVQGHVKALAGRSYITENTVPYILMFIPSEQIFSLVMETCPDLIDQAMEKKVVLTSPMTLYAMLAVIRQAAENANVVKTADEIISLLGSFDKQWRKYNEEVDRLGKQIDTVASQFRTVSGTRSNVLQRQLNKIEDLRQQRGLPEPPE